MVKNLRKKKKSNLKRKFVLEGDDNEWEIYKLKK
jgi:hypothetical protein